MSASAAVRLNEEVFFSTFLDNNEALRHRGGRKIRLIFCWFNSSLLVLVISSNSLVADNRMCTPLKLIWI